MPYRKVFDRTKGDKRYVVWEWDPPADYLDHIKNVTPRPNLQSRVENWFKARNWRRVGYVIGIVVAILAGLAICLSLSTWIVLRANRHFPNPAFRTGRY